MNNRSEGVLACTSLSLHSPATEVLKNGLPGSPNMGRRWWGVQQMTHETNAHFLQPHMLASDRGRGARRTSKECRRKKKKIKHLWASVLKPIDGVHIIAIAETQTKEGCNAVSALACSSQPCSSQPCCCWSTVSVRCVPFAAVVALVVVVVACIELATCLWRLTASCTICLHTVHTSLSFCAHNVCSSGALYFALWIAVEMHHGLWVVLCVIWLMILQSMFLN